MGRGEERGRPHREDEEAARDLPSAVPCRIVAEERAEGRRNNFLAALKERSECGLVDGDASLRRDVARKRPVERHALGMHVATSGKATDDLAIFTGLDLLDAGKWAEGSNMRGRMRALHQIDFAPGGGTHQERMDFAHSSSFCENRVAPRFLPTVRLRPAGRCEGGPSARRVSFVIALNVSKTPIPSVAMPSNWGTSAGIRSAR